MKKYTSTVLGLEQECEKKIFWVEDEYRKNELSFTEGGTDVIVDYFDKDFLLGYDKVKNIILYVDQIKTNLLSINSIWVKVYKTKDEQNELFFVKVWDGSFLKKV